MNKTILIFLVFLPLTVFASDSKGNITVKMDGFRSDKGDVRISLFKSADGFPEEKAYKKTESKIKTGKSEAVFTDIPYGEYAISIYHDENANREMDKNFMGIPKEGNGVSNNPESFGPPKFEDAKFTFNSKGLDIHIKTKY